MDFQTMIYNILLTVVTTATPILVGYVVLFIRNHANAKQLHTAKVISLNAVTFANQVSSELDLNNEAKFNSALASAKELASKYGIKLSNDQWKNLIEPSVNEIKKGLITLTEAPVIVQNIAPLTSLPLEESDSTEGQIQEDATIPELLVNPETVAVPSVEATPEIVPIVALTEEILPVVPVLNIVAIQQAVSTQMQELATKIATESVQKIMDDAVALAISNQVK
ncbi:MAG TPA: phage holin, LLH family [Clostridium sp.]